MSEKYSKRDIEKLLRQTSGKLSEEADDRIRRSLSVDNKVVTGKKTDNEEIDHFTIDARDRRGGRRSMVGLTTVLAVAAIVCAVLLTVWVRSLRKDPSGSGQTGTDPTPEATETVAPTPTGTAKPTTKPTSEPKFIEMPDYSGQDFEEVGTKLSALNMNLSITYLPTRETDDEYPNAGQVIRHLPAAGERLYEGAEVRLWYIDREWIEIGDYRGMTSEQVREAVGGKLLLRIDWAMSDVVEENHVIDTEPTAGESLAAGSTLTVILSQGNSKVTSVPDVVGKTEDDAEAILIASGLNYITETAYSDTVPAGIVMEQSPDTTLGKMEKGSVVKLVISIGEKS